MWTSEAQLVGPGEGHLRARAASADQGLCSRQHGEWWLQSKCQSDKFHSTTTESSSKVYLHFRWASSLKRQCHRVSRWISDRKALKTHREEKVTLPWNVHWKDPSLTCLFLLVRLKTAVETPSLTLNSFWVKYKSEAYDSSINGRCVQMPRAFYWVMSALNCVDKKEHLLLVILSLTGVLAWDLGCVHISAVRTWLSNFGLNKMFRCEKRQKPKWIKAWIFAAWSKLKEE